MTKIEITTLQPPDFEEAGIMLGLAFGGPGREDGLRFNYDLQPDGWFCARSAGRILGAVGAMDYGPFASVGMMGVHPDARRQGIGIALMRRLVAWLDDRGCPAAFLDATEMGAPMYEQLGFVDRGRTFRLDRTDHRPSRIDLPPGIVPMLPADLPAVSAFDTPIFGAARPAVIEGYRNAYPDRGFVARDPAGQVQGFLIAQSAIIGPWSAQTPAIAQALLDAALTLAYDESSPRVLAPAANQPALDLLSKRGFVKQRDLRHMQRGGVSEVRDPSRLYGGASFMLG